MIRETLFYQYINNREGKEIIEDEHGFIIYKVNGNECFIAEMFIREDARGTSALPDLLRHLHATAKANGCKVITANIDLRDKGAMRTLHAALHQRFRVAAANNDVLLIVREV